MSLYLVITANHGMRKYSSMRTDERVYKTLGPARCFLTTRTSAYDYRTHHRSGADRPVQDGYSGAIYEVDCAAGTVTLIESRGKVPEWLTATPTE